ncbi:cholecystokinin receptor type A-like [Mya arenaria]|uniref:cholecystokinin receptor type A-like n=1 Tax=Mya arenaria TaxID=6604 RepID=UPI0022E47697|nr:cholecystokinin receptor type A-like [Mya arenaria]
MSKNVTVSPGWNTTPSGTEYVPAANYQALLMTIYVWPFTFVVICTVLGVVGNTVVLYVYVLKWERTKTRIFIIVLAVINFINSIFNMPVEAYILYHPLVFDFHWLCKTTRGVTFIINNVCACLFVAIAIDRMLLVYQPLRRRVLTVRYVKWSCTISFVIGTATSWPGSVFYGTATLPEVINGVTIVGKTCFLSDDFLANQKWPKIFNVVLFVLMVFVFAILIVLYVIVGKRIYTVTKSDTLGKKPNNRVTIAMKSVVKHINFRGLFSSITRQPSDLNSEENVSESGNDVTDKYYSSRCGSFGRRISRVKMRGSYANTTALLLITATYIISFLPYLVVVSLRYVNPDFYKELSVDKRIVYHVFLRTYFLNSVISPFIYGFVNKKFRTFFKNCVCGVLPCRR